MSRVLVAGGGGYIGSKLVLFLLQKNFEVTVIDRFFFGDTLSDLRNNKRLRIIKDDVRTFDKKYLIGIYAVINLAAISNDPASDLDPNVTDEINHKGAVRLAKLAKEMGVKKYIFSSSCSVYGASSGVITEKSPLAPISEYAYSKIKAEEEILKISSENFCVVILRLATVYGLSTNRMRFDLIVNMMTLHAWRNNEIFVMGGGEQWRPLVHINDVVGAFYKILNTKNHKGVQGEIFNVGSNDQNFQVFQVASMFRKYFPELKIEVAPDDPDKRSYNVNFDKISKMLKYKTEFEIKDGITEIKEALEKGLVSDEIKTNTLRYYHYLMEANRILLWVKLNGKLF